MGLKNYTILVSLIVTQLSFQIGSASGQNISDEFKSEPAFTSKDNGGGGGGCGAKFTLPAMDKRVTDKCVELIGMRMEYFPPKREDLIKINYDDKCFSKCYLTEINYLTASDSFDRTSIMEEIKKTAPKEKLITIMNSINKCISATESMARVDGGIANSICKYALVFFACQRDEERKMVC